MGYYECQIRHLRFLQKCYSGKEKGMFITCSKHSGKEFLDKSSLMLIQYYLKRDFHLDFDKEGAGEQKSDYAQFLAKYCKPNEIKIDTKVDIKLSKNLKEAFEKSILESDHFYFPSLDTTYLYRA